MKDESLLRPMAPDALTRRRDTVASASASSPAPFLSEEAADPACLHKPEFAPLPVRKAEETEASLDELLSGFLAEEDADEPDGDAVPTQLMPVPVCVPLYEMPAPKRRRRRK